MVSPAEILQPHLTSGHLFLASDVGVKGYVLQRQVEAGKLERILHGVYLSTAVVHHPLIEEGAVSLRTPNAVVGLLSALVYHELTTEWARGVWILIPRTQAPPQSQELDIHAIRVLPESIDPAKDADLGIMTVAVHGVSMRMTDPIRTVVDCLKHKRRIRRGVALDSLRALRRSEHWDGGRFYQLARQFGVWSGVQLYLEGMR